MLMGTPSFPSTPPPAPSRRLLFYHSFATPDWAFGPGVAFPPPQPSWWWRRWPLRSRWLGISARRQRHPCSLGLWAPLICYACERARKRKPLPHTPPRPTHTPTHRVTAPGAGAWVASVRGRSLATPTARARGTETRSWALPVSFVTSRGFFWRVALPGWGWLLGPTGSQAASGGGTESTRPPQVSRVTCLLRAVVHGLPRCYSSLHVRLDCLQSLAN